MAWKPSPFVQAADAFVAADKTPLFGNAPGWQPARDDYAVRLKIPLERDGEHHSGEYLTMDAYPDRHPNEFKIGLMFGDRIIDRLDYTPKSVHPNPLVAPVPYVVMGPHWHSWELNRVYIKGGGFQKLVVADHFHGAKQFDAALRWYCKARNITLGAHPIEFPHPEQLFQ